MNNPHNHLATVRHWAIGLATTGLLGSSLVLAPAASAATVIAPRTVPDGLSIAITDGAAATDSSASLRYTVTVTNGGTVPATGELVITLPTFAAFSEAEGSHKEKSEATWKVTIAPGTSERRHASAVVGRIPADEVRVTTLATLYASADRSRILVRAADADAIHGVLDPAHTVGRSPEKVIRPPDDPALLVVGISTCAALLTLVLAGIVVFRRRRSIRARAG